MQLWKKNRPHKSLAMSSATFGKAVPVTTTKVVITTTTARIITTIMLLLPKTKKSERRKTTKLSCVRTVTR